MSQQLLRRVPKQTSLNFTERRGILRGMHSIPLKMPRQRLKVVISLHYLKLLKTTEASLIRLYEQVNNNAMICRY